MRIRRARERGFPRTGEVYSGDEADPRLYFGEPDRSRKGNWKALQLCKQVERAVAIALASECENEALLGAAVAAVEPAPDAGRLLVTIVLAPGMEAHGLTEGRMPSCARRRRSARRWPVGSTASACRRSSSTWGSRWRWIVNETSDAVVRCWAEPPLARDVERALRALARSDDVRRIAVMPDVHLSADVCVGHRRGHGPHPLPERRGRRHRLRRHGAGLRRRGCAARRRAPGGRGAGRPLSRHSRSSATGGGEGTGLPARPRRARRSSTPALESLKRTEGALQLGTLGGATTSWSCKRTRRAALADAPQRLARHRPGDPRPPPRRGHGGPHGPALPRRGQPRGPGLSRGHGVGAGVRRSEPARRW